MHFLDMRSSSTMLSRDISSRNLSWQRLPNEVDETSKLMKPASQNSAMNTMNSV